MKYYLCHVSIEIFSFLQQRATVSYTEGRNSSLGLLISPIDCKGSSNSSRQLVLWKQLWLLLPFSQCAWFSSTQSVGVVNLGHDMGFLPLRRQGLSITGRELVELVYICSAVGLVICLSYGWHSNRWSLPPSARLCISYHCYSPFGSSRRGNNLVSSPWTLRAHIQ